MRIYGRRTLALSVVVGLIGLAIPSSSGAATQIGETFTPTTADLDTTLLQSTSPPEDTYAAPFAGVITSWSYQAGATPRPVKLKVGRSAGGNNFTIIGDSPLKSPMPNQLNTYTDVRVPVRAGDVIGIYVGSPDGNIARTPAPTYSLHYLSGDVASGTTTAFSPFASYQLDVSARLELDCDADGLGDETQDSDTSSCNPPAAGDTTPPQTTITKRPKDKTKKKQATLEFTSSEPGSSFLCGFDGDPLTACTSPETEKVGKGKHEFDVVAVDPAGNKDATPAEDSWKVKKKKK